MSETTLSEKVANWTARPAVSTEPAPLAPNSETPQPDFPHEPVLPTPVNEGLAVESVGGLTPAMVIKFPGGAGEVDVFRGVGVDSHRHFVNVRRGPASITVMDGHRPPIKSEHDKVRSQRVEIHGGPDQISSVTAFGNLLSVDATHLPPSVPVRAQMGAAVYRQPKNGTGA